jgi:hypothetical protein
MNTPPRTTSLDQVRRLIDYFESGAIPRLAQHEVHPSLLPGSRDNYLYFTLPVCINFQRSSPAMWAAALRTYQDPATRYVFYPEQLANTPTEQIRSDLTRYKLALQPNKHVQIWAAIAQTLHRYYYDDPREIIAEAGHDAGRLIQLLQKTHRARFPYLCGPKLSSYWPYMLSNFTNVQFRNAHEISIIPDTHVVQSSVRLGLVPPGATALQVEAAWRELLASSGITPAEVHPVLWNWSRNMFQPSV